MPRDDYYQEYGPIQRRRRSSRPDPDAQPHATTELLDLDTGTEARRPARRAVRRRLTPLSLLLYVGLLLGALVLALPFGIQILYRDQALPGVSVQGLPVAGQSREVISSALAARYSDFLRQPLTLRYGQQTWQPTAEQLGMQFETESLTNAALNAGREGNPITRLQSLWLLWREGLEVTPRVVVNQRVLQNYLVSLASQVEQPPQDAALSVAEGKVIGTPSASGRQFLVDSTANDVLLALQTLQPQQVNLRTRTLEPSINDTALLLAQTEAKALLSSPLVLNHNGRNWTWQPARLAELLRVEATDGRIDVGVDGDRLTRAVEQLAQLVDSGTAEPRVRFTGNALQILQTGQPGWRLEQPDAVQVISTTLRTEHAISRTLTLPVEELKPRVTPENLGTLGITELVGEGNSSFAGSAQYRITNIKAGAARMDGVLIAPGEEFSFNTELGEINGENGFVQGYAIIGNRTQLEWGGGICQNATTAFRAAFWAGLPITERHPHAFYISWYDRFGLGPYGDGAGLDAAIFTGVNDLRFVNNTSNWLLMQNYVDEANQTLTVRLYGTSPNREVLLDGPYVSNETRAPAEPVYLNDSTRPAGTVYQSDVARSGRDITVYRIVRENGTEISRDTIFTRFKAWPNVFVRGTGS
ncbi:MAG: VanW family protein [Chloroflexaceae bacterium]|nr:VanW family protein [Chloroflexaceae bacterium]